MTLQNKATEENWMGLDKENLATLDPTHLYDWFSQLLKEPTFFPLTYMLMTDGEYKV